MHALHRRSFGAAKQRIGRNFSELGFNAISSKGVAKIIDGVGCKESLFHMHMEIVILGGVVVSRQTYHLCHYGCDFRAIN